MCLLQQRKNHVNSSLLILTESDIQIVNHHDRKINELLAHGREVHNLPESMTEQYDMHISRRQQESDMKTNGISKKLNDQGVKWE